MELKFHDKNLLWTPLNKPSVFVLLGVIILTSLFIEGLSLRVNQVFIKNIAIESMATSHNNPLLLNSGLVKAEEAELRIVLWFDKGKPAKGLLKNLPEENWVWQESINPIGVGYSIAGYTRIDKESEKSIYLWYQNLAQLTAQAGGIAYLDERVPEGIDIARYALKQNILPRQLTLSEGIYSVVGWQESYSPQIVAGHDKINIQLISHGYDQGKTALAIPVLLEEF